MAPLALPWSFSKIEKDLYNSFWADGVLRLRVQLTLQCFVVQKETSYTFKSRKKPLTEMVGEFKKTIPLKFH
jgi:hypothetical protein